MSSMGWICYASVGGVGMGGDWRRRSRMMRVARRRVGAAVDGTSPEEAVVVVQPAGWL